MIIHTNIHSDSDGMSSCQLWGDLSSQLLLLQEMSWLQFTLRYNSFILVFVKTTLTSIKLFLGLIVSKKLSFLKRLPFFPDQSHWTV